MAQDLLKVIESLPEPEVLVIGDAILDRYVTGRVGRISPEAPIPVLRHADEYDKAGGMAAVARNLARLNARVGVAAVVGDDEDGTTIRSRLADLGVHCAGLVAEPGRPTTRKTRFVAASQHAQQQILRVDREEDSPLAPATEDALLDVVRHALGRVNAIVLSDYDKGVLRGPLCGRVIEAARSAGVPVIVDPKGADFTRYRGASAVTPNRKEAGGHAGLTVRSAADARLAAECLVKDLDLDHCYVTMDRDGIFVLDGEGRGEPIPTTPREVYDVTGAGDNVISVLAYSLAAGLDPFTAARLANVAGSIAVEHFGVVTIGWDQIASRVASKRGGVAKLVTPDVLTRLLRGARAAGRKIVFTNGCFDILHPGHVDYLRRARELGHLLVVGLNDDESVRRLKGPTRPVNELEARAAVLGGLASVDYIVAFPEDTPQQLIELIRPDVLAKGSDWKEKGVVGAEFVESYGGRVELVDLVEGHSTTKTIERANRQE
ncbi:MAG: D-glycero-beta-D-manno-heptose 1-phosphate adenylyltransferase [Planctomycetota bacterium]|jgi:D-beta-D-heptose 7-phosphate kinase/D-beta-D-heptose 1-phosphate adenosyltransferase